MAALLVACGPSTPAGPSAEDIAKNSADLVAYLDAEYEEEIQQSPQEMTSQGRKDRYAMLPPLLLQPLVENAVRHGLAGKGEGGRIWITAAAGEDGAHLVLEVRDNGTGGAPEPGPSGGVGLANVRARLRALYGMEGRLEIVSGGEGEGFTARLRLPLRLDASAATTKGAPPAG